VARSIHRLGVLTGRDPNALGDLLARARAAGAARIAAVGDPATSCAAAGHPRGGAPAGGLHRLVGSPSVTCFPK